MKILVVGDSHANASFMRSIVSSAYAYECPYIVSVGDFGYWPGNRDDFLNELSDMLRHYGIQLFWVDGNHENHNAIETLVATHGADQFIPTEYKNISYIPRGCVWRWDGLLFAGMGGAYSIDRSARARYVDWFPQEEIKYSDTIKLMNNLTGIRNLSSEYSSALSNDVWVLFSHDAPSQVAIPGVLPLPEAMWNRDALSHVVAESRPQVLIHGHYHVDYNLGYVVPDTNHFVDVHGLDCDRKNRKNGQSFLILDTKFMSIQRNL